MGLTSKIKLGLAVIVAGLILGLWLYASFLAGQRDGLANERDLLNARLDQLGAQLAESRRQAETLAWELDLGRRALKAREAEKARLADEMGRLADELEKLYELDCEAGAWADDPLPDGVVQRLRGQ